MGIFYVRMVFDFFQVSQHGLPQSSSRSIERVLVSSFYYNPPITAS